LPPAARIEKELKHALEELCLSCALCCDGTLFHDVRLRVGDKTAPLKALGLPLRTWGNSVRLLQPCPALDGMRCQAYKARPHHCRHFDCLLYKAVQKQEVTWERALKLVQAARKQAQRVRRLIAKLETGRPPASGLDLRQRYTRLAIFMETTPCTPEQAALFSDLTLAFHRLNLRLRKHFVDN
jgi:Fe-S-cluster containining protein